ncbi:MAG: glycosyltransferase family 4 protein [Tepidisphaeraceae bacterium]
MTRTMKLLLVILHADSSRGGAELYTVTLFRKLQQAGHDVRIAAATFETTIDFGRRVPLSMTARTRLGRYRAFLDSLEKHRAAERYDAVHAMLPAPCDVYHPHAGLEAIGWRQASALQRWSNRRRRAFVETERALLTGARPPFVLCLSDQARAQARAVYPEARERFLTLHSAVDDARFVPRESPAAPTTDCVFVGQDFHRKGLDIALRALARTRALRLRVVGRDDPSRYRALAAELGIADRVDFAGPSSDVAGELARAGALVVPARTEPFGMVVAEAMLMGAPPVVSANAGASEIVRDGVDGRIVAGESPADWAAAIEDVLKNRATYSAACLARRTTLSYSHHLSFLLELYERIRAERPL